MNHYIPTSVGSLFSSFAPAFSTPTLANFVTICSGWILRDGRHTISRVILSGRLVAKDRHHSTLYRFFSRARWSTDSLGRIVFELALRFIPNATLTVIVDDTLCRKTGPSIWGSGVHHDPLVSTYGRSSSRTYLGFAFGHNWVVLSLWVPLPWDTMRGVALPVLARLYRSKRHTPAVQYRKRTELAADLITKFRGWVPRDRKLRVVGDGEYACKTVLRSIPDEVQFVGPLVMKARLWAPLSAKGPPRKLGRRRVRGNRLPSPREFAQDKSVPWRKTKVTIYGGPVVILYKTRIVLWYSVCGTRKVRMVLTRDPKRLLDDKAYFSTEVSSENPSLESTEVQAVLSAYSRRWSLEATFFNTKQFLGLEDPQNGWGRRKRRSKRKRPGPQARGRRGAMAAQRTVPFIFCVYGIVTLWYFENGSPQAEIKLVRRLMPWYRHKRTVSFSDMLRAIRREFYQVRIKSNPASHRVAQELVEYLLEGSRVA